jgi:hypothetical protein
MKAWHVVVLAAVAGVALGSGMSWARFGHSPPFRPVSDQAPSPEAAVDRPKVWVDETFHDFGRVDRDSQLEHKFRFKNIGDRTLTLKPGGTTCAKCTIAELSQPEVAPGETVDVTVIYKTTFSQPTFRQTARVLTNDPEQPRVELNISGVVTSRFSVVPEGINLSKVSSNAISKGEVRIFSFLTDEIEVTAHEFTEPGSAPYFEVETGPLARDQLNEPEARGGCRVQVTLKPGLPLGPIRQTIRLTLRMQGIEDTPAVDVSIYGTVESDLSIVGPGWDAEHARLTMGSKGVVESGRGTTSKLLVLVRGEHRHEVTLKPIKIEPSWLKVTVEPPSDLASGPVTQIPLVIEIPKGTPPVNHRGSDQGKYGEIVLETTHPDLQQIRISLQFVVVP